MEKKQENDDDDYDDDDDDDDDDGDDDDDDNNNDDDLTCKSPICEGKTMVYYGELCCISPDRISKFNLLALH